MGVLTDESSLNTTLSTLSMGVLTYGGTLSTYIWEYFESIKLKLKEMDERVVQTVKLSHAMHFLQ